MLSVLPACVVQRAEQPPDLASSWDSPDWRDVPAIDVASFHPLSSSHQPRTQVKVLYDSHGLYHHFQVHDRYVLARQLGYQGPVFDDSCVEFFTAPHDRSYFNFEFNCGGAMLLHHIQCDGSARELVSDHWLDRITIRTTLPRQVDPQIDEPITWRLACFIPIKLIQAYTGPLGEQTPAPGVQWRSNWFKCASRSTHPHWAAWADVGLPLNFHQVDRFGLMQFA